MTWKIIMINPYDHAIGINVGYGAMEYGKELRNMLK